MASQHVDNAHVDVTLDDKWKLDHGRIVLNGSQAIGRILLAQSSLDRRAGLKTAGYITGYRGSPLGNVDSALWQIGKRLKDADIVFQPGVNEDMAATAVSGTQQLDAVPGARFDGVFAAWYGKGPGVDRSIDALKHGNFTGAHRNGGVLLFYGDDHAGKSSTVSHQSEQAVASCMIPSLYPSDVAEMIRFGLLGIALSRYSGSWVGIKCVNEVAEQTQTVELDDAMPSPILPDAIGAGPVHVNNRRTFNPIGDEQVVSERRLPLVAEFVRANGIDRATIRAKEPVLGLVTSGKAYGDVRAALALLGLDDEAAARIGISLYKVGCIWPLEATGIEAFSSGQSTLLVIEEKRSFIEEQIAAALINKRQRPLLIGKLDEDGRPLLSSTLPLDPAQVARVIADRLERLGLLTDTLRAARDQLALPVGNDEPASARRAPYFCSGCPHNTSTRIPEGSLSATGIGCHTMVNFVRPETALLPSQMGSEGGNWIGLAPFTDTPHMFQNMGDGTYYHSGLLAIRAAVAAKTNITFKILYNDAVAMTGGQPVDGPISVSEIARQVTDEGVARVVVVSDAPEKHRRDRRMPGNVEIDHRDALDEVQKTLREIPGCTVLIYEQTCAAEKRRRRKRGQFPDPQKRLFISKAVCEGCGDCSVQSTCVSLAPVETAFGRKRAIDQSSCNKDYSCLKGFCPSFLTITGADLRKPEALVIDESRFESLPVPPPAAVTDTFNLLVAGIGGTGVVTVGAIIGMAAHLEGKAMSIFDMTGLAQKNGAVYSHLVIAPRTSDFRTQRIGRQQADLMLAFDLVAATAPEAIDTLNAGRSRVIANCDVPSTVSFQFDRDFTVDPGFLLGRVRRIVGADALGQVHASFLASAITGDAMATNFFLVGVAAQRGLLPVGVAAIEKAIRLNAVAVPFNLRAFRLGRLFAVEPGNVEALAKQVGDEEARIPETLDELLDHRASHLRAYQNDQLANRYRSFVERVRAKERAVAPAGEALSLAVARNYAKLLAYKDEYEVARLLSDPSLYDEIRQTFSDGARISFNLASPALFSRIVNGRPAKRQFGPWMRPMLRLMSRFKGLRGTLFDPFGRTQERRTERALIAEYEALVERVLETLTPDNHDLAVELLALVDSVRGYGPVKAEAVENYRASLTDAEARFALGRTVQSRSVSSVRPAHASL